VAPAIPSLSYGARYLAPGEYTGGRPAEIVPCAAQRLRSAFPVCVRRNFLASADAPLIMAEVTTRKGDPMEWQPDWPQAKANLAKWWNREGLVLNLTAPRPQPIEDLPPPPPSDDLAFRWTDPSFRVTAALWDMARRHYYADAFPHLPITVGPGSLGIILGSHPHFMPTTAWYEPCIHDPDTYGPIRFVRENNRWLDVHLAIMDEALRRARGRYIVAMPDLIENLDTLAAMRGNEALLVDLVDRPAWVHARLAEINEAFFAAFDLLYARVEVDGGNAFIFDLWGPGKTCKVQCDFSCMISARMFRDFVVPPLAAQCDWLDFSMYHLDGTQARHHVPALLEIESLDAIEWTPQAGIPNGGSPMWYDLYRQIKRGGKSVQAVGVEPEDVIPLIEAVGPEGLFITCSAPDEATAERLVERTTAVSAVVRRVGALHPQYHGKARLSFAP